MLIRRWMRGRQDYYYSLCIVIDPLSVSDFRSVHGRRLRALKGSTFRGCFWSSSLCLPWWGRSTGGVWKSATPYPTSRRQREGRREKGKEGRKEGRKEGERASVWREGGLRSTCWEAEAAENRWDIINKIPHSCQIRFTINMSCQLSKSAKWRFSPVFYSPTRIQDGFLHMWNWSLERRTNVVWDEDEHTG